MYKTKSKMPKIIKLIKENIKSFENYFNEIKNEIIKNNNIINNLIDDKLDKKNIEINDIIDPHLNMINDKIQNNDIIDTYIYNNNDIQNSFKSIKFNNINLIKFSSIIKQKPLENSIMYRNNNKLNNLILFSKDIKKNSDIKEYILIDKKDINKYITFDNHIYEILNKYDENENYKLYLDIDKNIKTINLDIENEQNIYIKQFFINGLFKNELFYNELIEFINLLIDYINKKFNINSNDYYILKSECNYKISYHIIFNNIIFDNLIKMKYFINNFCKDLNENNLIKYDFIDKQPYGKNQSLRVINQSKYGKQNKLIFCDYHLNQLYKSIFETVNINDNENLEYWKINYIKNNSIKSLITINKECNIIIDNINEFETYHINHNNKNSLKINGFEIIFNDKEIESVNEFINDKIIYKIIDKINNLNNEKFYIWYNIIKTIKLLTNDIKLFEKFNGDKYDKKKNLEIWNNIKDNNDINYKINSIINVIFHLIKIDNEYFLKINKKYIFIKSYFKYNNIYKNYNKIKDFYNIDKSLVDKIIELSKNDLTDGKFLDKNIIIDNYKNNYRNIIIKSGLGSGKTISVCSFLKFYLDNINKKARILIISPRISYSNSIKTVLYNKLKIKFDLYNDENIDINKSEYLIMSIFSICKLQKQKYDIIVLDEIESNLKCFDNSKCHIDMADNFLKLTKILEHSYVNLFLDGDINNTSLTLIKTIKKVSVLIINNNSNNFRNVEIYYDENEVEKQIQTDLDNGKNIVIFHNSKTHLKLLNNIQFESYKTICHYSKSEHNKIFSELDENGNLININKQWSMNENRILLFNNSITVGIDFDMKYYNKIYVFYDNFLNVRDVIQSINRIRNYIDEKIIIHNYGNNKINDESNNLNVSNILDIEDNKMTMFLGDILKSDHFRSEYKEYIEDYNNRFSIENNEINGLDGEIITKQMYLENIINNKVLTDEQYLDTFYNKMSDLLKQLYNRTLLEKEYSKTNSNSLFLYFFNEKNYNVKFIFDGKKNITNTMNLSYLLIENNYIKYFREYFDDYYDVDISTLKNIDKLNKIILDDIINNQKKNKTSYQTEEFDLFRNYILFNRFFDIKNLSENDLDDKFTKYNSSYYNKYFERLRKYINGKSIYDEFKRNLKNNKLIELINYEILTKDEIFNNVLKLLNINKENITDEIIIDLKQINLVYNYIDENINFIEKVNLYKDIIKKNKNKRYKYYSLIKEILTHINISIINEDLKNNTHLKNPKYILNKKNFLSGLIVKKYDNINN